MLLVDDSVTLRMRWKSNREISGFKVGARRHETKPCGATGWPVEPIGATEGVKVTKPVVPGA